jgi:hypothetical protein
MIGINNGFVRADNGVHILKKRGPYRLMFATRMEKSYAGAVERLLAHHGGLQFSKYLRGLIYTDAVRCGIPTADLDRPSWVSRSYPDLFDGRQGKKVRK